MYDLTMYDVQLIVEIGCKITKKIPHAQVCVGFFCCFIGMDSDSLVLFIQTCRIRFYMMEGVVEFVSYV